MVFECKECGFYTNVKCNFIRHQSSEKHKRIAEKEVLTQKCRYCNQSFTSKQSLDKHEKYRCISVQNVNRTNLNTEVKELKKLVQLLNLQLTQTKLLLETKNTLIENLTKYNELKIN